MGGGCGAITMRLLVASRPPSSSKWRCLGVSVITRTRWCGCCQWAVDALLLDGWGGRALPAQCRLHHNRWSVVVWRQGECVRPGARVSRTAMLPSPPVVRLLLAGG
ncbi:hypothetical protein FKM82_027708 [Ascaphus truei]